MFDRQFISGKGDVIFIAVKLQLRIKDAKMIRKNLTASPGNQDVLTTVCSFSYFCVRTSSLYLHLAILYFLAVVVVVVVVVVNDGCCGVAVAVSSWWGDIFLNKNKITCTAYWNIRFMIFWT